MSKITNDALTRPGTGRFIAVPIRQQWASKCQRLRVVTHLCLSSCRSRMSATLPMRAARGGAINVQN